MIYMDLNGAILGLYRNEYHRLGGATSSTFTILID